MKKQRYVSRETAELILIEMRGQPWDDPRLHPYRCRIGQDHFHLGHASGRDARRLKHRHEKARRKALIAGLDLQQR